MKRDWLKQLLGEAATDEVVNALMEANGNDVNAAKVAKGVSDKALEEAQARIDELEAKASENMTAEQKWQSKLAEETKRADKAMRDLNEATAAAVFAGAGMSEDEYRPFIGSVAGGTREQTTEAAKAIAAVVTAKAEAARDAAKKEALASMTPPAGGGGDGAIKTKEQFRAMSDADQIRWKSENPDAWKTLS